MCELVYKELAHRASEPPTKRWLSWVTELDLELSELDWLDSIPRIINCTTSTKLQSLGYRFIIRDVLTNHRQVHMGKVDTNMCYICKSEVETIEHLYWVCPNNRRLWERLKHYIKETLGLKSPLGPLELLFGVSEQGPEEGPAEIVILLSTILKNYIHYSKCKNIIPTENGLVKNIDIIYNI